MKMETSNIPINHFDRGKPFYPLIMNYLVFLYGIKEISLRGMLNLVASELPKTGLLQVRHTRQLEYELSPRVIEVIGIVPKDAKLTDILEIYITKVFPPDKVPPQFASLPKMVNDVESGIRKLAGPLQLVSKFQGTPIEIPLDFIADEIANNFPYLLPFTMRAAGSLLILAFETTLQYHDNGPLWEFLRHCRNAVAHNGRFRFEHGEPRHLAEWGRFHLEVTMHGSPLFRVDEQTPGFLEPGDAIRLLWDIEQAYPNMQVSV